MDFSGTVTTILTLQTEAMETSQAASAGKAGTAAKEVVEDITYGSIAGMIGKVFEYPFDTVKTRLQVGGKIFNGPLDCFQKALRNDGFLSLYAGVSVPIIMAGLENSSLFVFERLGQRLLLSSGLFNRDQPLPSSSLYVSGAFSGFFTAFILTPMEKVKVRIQVPGTTLHRSPALVTREIYRTEGLKGFTTGLLGTIVRETGGCAAWFGAKQHVGKLFRERRERLAICEAERSRLRVQDLPLWQQAVAGGAGGVTYNFVCFPADTVKNKMQAAKMGEALSSLGAAKQILAESGVRGLYAGCGLTCARSMVSSALIFMAFDALKSKFSMPF